MKKILTTLLFCVFGLAVTAQNTVYENTFDSYDVATDIVTQGDYYLDAYQLTDEPRTLVIAEEDGNKFMSYDIPAADPNKGYNTMIKGSNEFALKAGVTYTFTAKTRGAFVRGLRVINPATNAAVAAEALYNATNDAEKAAEWYEHSLTITPNEDMMGYVGILRNWNGKLDIDDLLIVDDQAEEETPDPMLPYVHYANDFSTYAHQEDVNEGDFNFEGFQQPELARSLTVQHDNDEEYLQLSIESTNAGANTIVRILKEFQFKAGVDYSVSMDTRGSFKRSIRVINNESGTADFVSEVYNATNDATLSSEWYNLQIEFTPTEDFTATIAVLREWNSNLDFDNIEVRSSEELPTEEEEEETPPTEESGYDVYFNDFTEYTENQDVDNVDFMKKVFQQEDLARTLTVQKEGENQFLKLTIEATSTSANTLVSVNQEFSLKAGVEYILRGKTRGKFSRSVRIVNVEDEEPLFSSEDYNARNDDALGAEWYQHEVVFTPEADATVYISVLRTWNGDLDIDDLQLRSTVDQEEETPGEGEGEEEETPGEGEGEEEETPGEGEGEEEETPGEGEGEEEETPGEGEGEEEETPGEGDITSIEDVDGVQLQVYPSPTNSALNIKYSDADSQPFVISILNTQGQVVQTVNKTSFSSDVTKITLDNKLQNGVYFIKISTSTSEVSKRFILLR
ncbi:T9SS type A sorting domain-containing protein [Flammeovirga pacifica]|uniref:Secretion system C-terminal sorting domain-containing protein n=1 Tax=Flammeovirga pacifica TaxID=915059 RepID=A0A1S1YUM0_FLAPC|nr:T9SS type A sorting domain-containing protein [Flammeovirga pacifica]OHX64719.1 hypothetical protein NH26_24460 [Flammeovirga pacifica]